MADPSDSSTTASALRREGQVVAGRYHVRRRLGRGASKDVYLAYDERLDREVALALVVGAVGGATAAARLEREARVTGRLGDHPNIITAYDTGEIDGVPFLVLRAMPGGSLAEALQDQRVALADGLRIGRDVALALAHAHAHGVIHRDVKPDNVWLAADGAAALGDFGIAHQAGADRLTTEGLVVGTARYLSPEQIRGQDVSPATDLYALGVTLYEIFTSRAPFTAQDPAHVLAQHLTAAPRPPSEHAPELPEGVERLILALLEKEPARRPSSAAAVAEALASPPPAQRPTSARRLVAVLSARTDAEDPEVAHAALERCAAVVERHGGSVERFLGDTLLALFGGDDTSRAAAAALELSGAALRLGIESGRVFFAAGPRGAAIATGAAIADATRLAERAGRGEILLGEHARADLSRRASLDPASGALLGLEPQRPALLIAPATPFVGREPELEHLRAALAQARAEAACRLVTVIGPAGIGKSRLAGSFLSALGEDVTVLAGACLPHGEGTTPQVLAEIARGLGPDPRARVQEALADDERAVRGVLGAIGLSGDPVQPDEASWALRRLFERLAAERPVVVAIEDVHWADPALLDLVDHVVTLSSGSPILILCLARPELLEARPAWAAPQPERSIIMLRELENEEALALAEGLGAGALATRITRRAEGNPLFIEQLVAVGDQGAELPTSIQAVLAARIDGLEAGERALLEHAAVEGRTFHAGALSALLPEDQQRDIRKQLVALARKGLVSAARPDVPGEEALRFTHALIGEVAYAGMAKGARAGLHERLADWLGERKVADEIIGYHLEQACRLAAELGRPERALASRAVERLQAAASAAMARGYAAAAGALLERAVDLVREDEGARVALLPALGAALFLEGRLTDAARVLDEAIERATDPELQALAQTEREFVRLEAETAVGMRRARGVAAAAMPVLERAGDAHGQCRAWGLIAQVEWIAGRVARADAAWIQAANHARRAGNQSEVLTILGWRATAAVLGPTPVAAAIRRCEDLRAHVRASPGAEAWTLNPLATLRAMNGEFELADRLLREANEILHELGSLVASVSHHEAFVRLLAGQAALAEVPLRSGIETLASMGDGSLLATTNAMLAQAVFAQGRLREAATLCNAAARDGAAEDIITQVIWRGVKAKILAREGCPREAEALAREAVALVQPTDLLSHKGDAMLDLADVLRTCSRPDESDRAVRAALALLEQKGNIVAASKAWSLLSNRPGRA